MARWVRAPCQTDVGVNQASVVRRIAGSAGYRALGDGRNFNSSSVDREVAIIVTTASLAGIS